MYSTYRCTGAGITAKWQSPSTNHTTPTLPRGSLWIPSSYRGSRCPSPRSSGGTAAPSRCCSPASSATRGSPVCAPPAPLPKVAASLLPSHHHPLLWLASVLLRPSAWRSRAPSPASRTGAARGRATRACSRGTTYRSHPSGPRDVSGGCPWRRDTPRSPGPGRRRSWRPGAGRRRGWPDRREGIAGSRSPRSRAGGGRRAGGCSGFRRGGRTGRGAGVSMTMAVTGRLLA